MPIIAGVPTKSAFPYSPSTNTENAVMPTPSKAPPPTPVSAAHNTRSSPRSGVEIGRAGRLGSAANSSKNKKFRIGTKKNSPKNAGRPASRARRTDMLTPIQAKGKVHSAHSAKSHSGASPAGATRTEAIGERKA